MPETALEEARAILDRDNAYRRWRVEQGGVYVRPNPQLPGDLYLVHPAKDVVTTDGLRLSLLSPAFVLREAQKRQEEPARGRPHRDGALPPVEGNAALLRQAFACLVDNALKSSSRCERPRVGSGAAIEGRAIRCCGRDNGAGFDRAHAASSSACCGACTVRTNSRRRPGPRQAHRRAPWRPTAGEAAPGAGTTFPLTLPLAGGFQAGSADECVIMGLACRSAG